MVNPPPSPDKYGNKNGHRRSSWEPTLGGQDIFYPKYIINIWKINKMPEFYMIFDREIHCNKISEFCMTFGQIWPKFTWYFSEMSDFFTTFTRKLFFPKFGTARAPNPLPPSPTHTKTALVTQDPFPRVEAACTYLTVGRWRRITLWCLNRATGRLCSVALWWLSTRWSSA